MPCLLLVACLAASSVQREDPPRTAVAVHAIRLLSEEAAQETTGSWSLEAVQLLVDSTCNQPLELLDSQSSSVGAHYTVSSSGERCPANPFGAGCFFHGPGGLASVLNQQPGAMFNYIWQGMPDESESTGDIWLAVEFDKTVTIGCIKLAQQDEKFSNAINVQVKANASSAWKTLCTATVDKVCPLELLATCCESTQSWQCEWVLTLHLTNSREMAGTAQPIESTIPPPSLSQPQRQPEPSPPNPLRSSGWSAGSPPAHPGFDVSIHQPQPSMLSLTPVDLQPYPATAHASPGPPMLPPSAAIPLHPIALAGGPSNLVPTSPKEADISPSASQSSSCPSMLNSGPPATATRPAPRTPTLLFNLVFSTNVPSSRKIPSALVLQEVIMEYMQGALKVEIGIESPRNAQVTAQFISPASALASISTVSSFQFLLDLQKTAGRKVEVTAIRTFQCGGSIESLMAPSFPVIPPQRTPPQPDEEEHMEKRWPYIGKQNLMIISVVSFVVSCFCAYGSAAAMLYSREGRNSNEGQHDLEVRAEETAAESRAHGEANSPEPPRPGYATPRGRIASQELLVTAGDMMSYAVEHTNQGVELESVLLPSTSVEATCPDSLTTASEIDAHGQEGGGCLLQEMETERF